MARASCRSPRHPWPAQKLNRRHAAGPEDLVKRESRRAQRFGVRAKDAPILRDDAAADAGFLERQVEKRARVVPRFRPRRRRQEDENGPSAGGSAVSLRTASGAPPLEGRPGPRARQGRHGGTVRFTCGACRGSRARVAPAAPRRASRASPLPGSLRRASGGSPRAHGSRPPCAPGRGPWQRWEDARAPRRA